MKNRIFSLMFAVAALVLCIAGCSSLESRAQKLHLGMTEANVVDLLGSDYTVAAARMDSNHVPVKVIQYEAKSGPPLYLYFRQNELVQWGDLKVLQAMPTGGT